MAQVDLTPVYQALREADAAGDEQAVKRLLAYIDEQERIAQSDIPQPSEPVQRPPQKPDIPTQVAQVGGVAARGVLGLPAFITQAAQEAWNLTTPAQAAVARQLGYNVTPESLQFAPENMAITDLERLTSRAGKPAGSNIVEAGIGALTGAGAARGVASVAKAPALQNLATTMGKNRVAQATGAMSGATAADIAREAGAGPLGQLTAGFAGAMAPTAAASGVRAALAGDRQQFAERKAQFAKAGVETPTVGQLSQGKGVQQVESIIGKVPGAYGVRESVREAQTEGMARKVDEIADRLGGPHSAEEAGRIIERGLTGKGGFVERFQQAQDIAYGKLDALVPPEMPVIPKNTVAALDSLSAPVRGAEATTGGLANPKIRELREALAQDLQKNARPTVAGEGRSGGLPYEALARIRSRVGQMLGENEMVSGAPRAQLKQLYAALSQDLKDAAAATGNPAAVQAFNRANALTRAGHERIDSVLQSVVSKNVPEIVFRSATNIADMKAGGSRIRTVLKSLKPEEADAVRGIFLRRLGAATPGKQNAEGDVFSPETFLTQWNKISPEAKVALFGRSELRRNLDAIAKTASDIRASEGVLANPSGTAAVGTSIGAATSVTGALASGYPMLAAGIAAAPLISHATARLMTSPKFIGWLAKEMKTPGATVSAASLQALAAEMEGQPSLVREDAERYINTLQQQGQAE